MFVRHPNDKPLAPGPPGKVLPAVPPIAGPLSLGLAGSADWRAWLGIGIGIGIGIATVMLVWGIWRLVGFLRLRSADAHRSLSAAESEALFRAIFQKAAIGIGQFTLDGRWVRANPKLCEITGYREHELAQKTFQDITHPADLKAELLDRQRVLSGEIPFYSRHKRYIRKDGSSVWVNLTVSLVRDRRGHPRSFVSIVEDLSARDAAQALQQASEARLNLALDAAGMGTWEWNVQTREVHGSSHQAELMGRKSDRLTMTFDEAMETVHPDDRPLVVDAINSAFDGRAPKYHCEFRTIWPDRSIHWLSADGNVLRDASDKATAIVGVSREVTERRESEQERQQLLLREQRARAEAEAANRRKDQFLAILSHELRTPLTPVLARLALLRADKTIPAESRNSLDMIRRNVEMEARLIDDLLDITRITRGKMHLNIEVVDAHEKMRNAIEIYEGDITAKGLHLNVQLDAEHHFVQADAARLQQVFWNLISNAMKYTPGDGSISVRSYNAAGTNHNGHLPRVIIEVSDTGIGIEPDVMSRLFNPFEQGEQVLTRRFAGLGLGLSISRSLVTMIGGNLTAASEGRNRGATFTVELKTTAPHAAPEAPKPRGGLRILLVEDNEDTLRAMSRLLRSDGYQVYTAATVKQAHEMADRQPFDVLISDIGLPDGSGWELMKSLRSRGPVRGIALSGFSMDEDIQKSKNVGFMEHLAKPINPQELEEAIQRVAS